MNKKTKNWLIAAVLFMLVGVIFFTGVMSMLKWDFKALNTTECENNTYTVSEQFKNISINTLTADVLFIKSDDDTCKVECVERPKEKHTVKVKDQTLNINVEDSRKWYDHITFLGFAEPQIKVYLPQEQYGSLVININTGDIEIPKEFTFDGIDIKGTTGDANCKASVINDLKIELTTGKTQLENITARNIELKASTGDTYLTNVNCDSLSSRAVTGHIKLKNVDAGKKLSIKRSIGDVKFQECDADEIFVNTNTGNVEGSLCTSKIFVCKTNTGKMSVPPTTEGGKCEIITNTGDITISVKKNMTSGYCIR